jgi:putative toxin-antitoxin system antitoxin component (TIGR02293 family)
MAHPSVAGSIFDKLGGSAVFPEKPYSDADLATIVLAGLPLTALEHTRLNTAEVHALVVSAKTLRLRRTRGQPLNSDETERLIRLTRIESIAEVAFQNDSKAAAWLRQPLPILANKVPLEMARTEPGARVIEQLIAKIAWGAAA